MAFKKEQYLEKLEAQLREWRTRFDELRSKFEQTDKAEVRARLQERMEGLKDKQEVVRGRLAELKEDSGEAWERMRPGIERAWDDLRKAIENAADRFRQEKK